MIDHVRTNIGREFLYILPIKPYPYKRVTDYIICRVRIQNIYNDHSRCLITEIIKDDPKMGSYVNTFKYQAPIICSNKYLFEIWSEK